MYANNRSGVAPKAVFRRAGGSIFTFAHPFLTGQITQNAQNGGVYGFGNEVNVTASLKLNETFFNAMPAQDNAIQEIMVDGSTVTITNHLMNGRATLSVIAGSGLVKDGDLTAIAPFIMSSGDDVGGVLTYKSFAGGKALTQVFYGVTFANFPHAVAAGNAVPVHSIVMLYSGWIQGVMESGEGVNKALWAVGNRFGYSGSFRPFTINGVGDTSVGGDTGQATEIDRLQGADGNTLGEDNISGNALGGFGDLDGAQDYSPGFVEG